MSNTKKLPRRKGTRKVRLVTFTVEGFDGTFEIPSMRSLSLGVQRRLTSGDLNPMVEALGDYAEVIDDMEGDEVEAFMQAWAAASAVPLDESAPAAS